MLSGAGRRLIPTKSNVVSRKGGNVLALLFAYQASTGEVADQGAGFWVLLLPTLATLITSVAGYILAHAGKIRADTLAIEQARDRESSLKTGEIALQKADANSLKLDQVMEVNKKLQSQLDHVKDSLSAISERKGDPPA